MKRVVVTGAGGAVGPLVVASFAEAGWQVVALTRTVPQAGVLPDGCVVRIADLFDDRALDAAMEGADAVVHLAGLLHVLDAPASLTSEYRRVNVDGTVRVVEAARVAGVGRVVLASTIAVYGPTDNGVVDESSPLHPDTSYAQSKLAAESSVLGAHQVTGESCGVVLRLAAVYGARVKGNYDRFVRALARGRFVPIGRGGNRRTLIHERDAARAFVLAAEHPRASGRVFNVTDGETHSVAAIIDAICEALGRRSPRWRVPIASASGAALCAEVLFQAFGRRSPVTRGTIAKYLETVEVSGDAIRRDLGFLAQRDLAQGWREAIVEMRRLGRI
jgi:nucleoside-diphosphate-sugar epimerase